MRKEKPKQKGCGIERGNEGEREREKEMRRCPEGGKEEVPLSGTLASKNQERGGEGFYREGMER